MPIYKTDGGYKIKNVKGKSKTKKEAIKRLMAIKASQDKESNPEKYDESGYKKASRRPNSSRGRSYNSKPRMA